MATETSAVQDYLKAIFQLRGHREPVSTSALSERLGVTPASVSGMVRRLHDDGFVTHAPYKGVKLTRRGARGAIEVIRHHRLLELYLERMVGVPWDKVHEEAEALEHVLSEDLESRLDELLGFPTTDPHGHPIPSAALELIEHDHATLDELEADDVCTVRSVDDDDPELLRHLGSLKLRPGARVEVIEVLPYGGGIRVRVDGDEQHVGPEAAAAVQVA